MMYIVEMKFMPIGQYVSELIVSNYLAELIKQYFGHVGLRQLHT